MPYKIQLIAEHTKALLLKYIFCLLLVYCIGTTNAQNIDVRILQSINGPASPSDAFWKDLSGTTSILAVATPASIVLTGLTIKNKELTTKGLQIAGSIIIAEGLTAGLKYTIKRQRPFDAYPHLVYAHSNPTDPSFPSGHTSVAFATATSVSIAFPKWYVIVPSFSYATAVGYSRLRLGVHYPSDVLAGALIGAGSSYLTVKLTKLLNKKHVH
ncbi:phosphatase PAP2 family protein [Mucilaginibacter auburnensis]|uniref:Undecaprenyl-diphosphatase n=1 Tax=Mucilaginibacter auburnensis TaxID=1457233 RepID=A0A2H9VRH3_9SPHI|nr:phosphatase PAP2 family protein [Mucilaginibacter auburnensis]PJJ83436.1 undecaprenyl-diphosphatase [Mucilaginibacter auburnensis]